MIFKIKLRANINVTPYQAILALERPTYPLVSGRQCALQQAAGQLLVTAAATTDDSHSQSHAAFGFGSRSVVSSLIANSHFDCSVWVAGVVLLLLLLLLLLRLLNN